MLDPEGPGSHSVSESTATSDKLKSANANIARYANAVEKVISVLEKQEKAFGGLYPVYINAEDGTFKTTNQEISFGACIALETRAFSSPRHWIRRNQMVFRDKCSCSPS